MLIYDRCTNINTTHKHTHFMLITYLQQLMDEQMVLAVSNRRMVSVVSSRQNGNGKRRAKVEMSWKTIIAGRGDRDTLICTCGYVLYTSLPVIVLVI